MQWEPIKERAGEIFEKGISLARLILGKLRVALEEFWKLSPAEKWKRVRIPSAAAVVLTILILTAPLFIPPKIMVSFPGDKSSENPLDSTIEIVFDRGMNRESVEKSFNISPTVPGTFAWEGNQKLIFTPKENLERGTSYTVSISGLVVSQTGSPLLGSRQIVFETLGDPKVAVYSPQTEAVEDMAPIMVVFDRPMIPLTTATNSAVKKPAFEITPPIEGEGRWLGTTAYQFLPSKVYNKSTTYMVSVPAGMQSQDGGSLAGGWSWEFSSMRPRVISTSPKSGYMYASPTASVSAMFNQKIDTTKASRFFKLLDENNQEVAGRLVVNGQRIGFYPNSPLVRAKTYQAVVAAGMPGAEGPNGMETNFSWNFKIAEKPAVLSTYPGDGAEEVSEENAVTVNFLTPMDEDSFTGNVSIYPVPDQKPGLYYYSYQNKNQLSIGTYMLRSSKYTITVGANVKDQYGVPLGQPYTFSFTTGPYDPSVSIVPSNTYFATFNQQIVPRIVAKVTNADSINYNLYRLDRNSFLDLYLKRYGSICGSDYSCRNWQNYDPSKLTKVRSWNETFEKNQNVPVNVITKVTDSNGGNIASGLYFLDVKIDNGRHDNMVMIVSNTTMTVKKSNQQIFTWAVDQSSGNVVGGMDMELTDQSGGSLAKGQTNQDGVWQQDVNLDNISSSLLIFGQKGSDTVVASSNWSAGVNRYDFGLPYYYNYAERKDYSDSNNQYKLYLTVDRPIYRPGQKVYFKGVIKKDNDAAYENVRPGEMVSVTIKDARGREVYNQTLPVNSFGSFSDSADLSTDANLGEYSVAAEYNRNSNTVNFQVEEYRKPDMNLTITTDSPEYVAGQIPQITINASYYYGAPITNAEVSWSLLTSDYVFSWDKDWRFEFGNPEDYWARWWGWGNYYSRKSVAAGKGTTDSKGNLTLSLPMAMGNYKTSQKLVLEADVTDLSNQHAGGSAEYTIHQAAIYPGLHPQSYGGKSGQENKIDVVTVGMDGEEAPKTAVSVRFYRRTWDTVKEQDPDTGAYMYVSKPHDNLVSQEMVTTDEFGYTTASFTPSEGGTYRVLATVTDWFGNTSDTSSYIWISGYGYQTQRQNNDRILIIPNKRDFDVGETASLFVDSPFASGSAKTLLTVERAKVISYRVTDTSDEENNFPISIEPNYAPNVYLGATLIKGGDLVTSPPEMKMGYVEVKVTDKKQQVAVDIQTDKPRYKPGETMQATITTRDMLGHPVSAELAVGLVDKAVWDLSTITLPDIYQFFYQPRNLEVDTSQLLSISMDRINANTNLGAKGGSGGCFTEQTQISVPGGTVNIGSLKPGDTVLTKAGPTSAGLVPAKVTAVFKHLVDRYLVINGDIEVTPVHMMYVNGNWKTAGEIAKGDEFLDIHNEPVKVFSIEQVFGKDIPVYNLDIEIYHTYFADGIYVHNQKGDFSDTARKDFPDTAYWNPALLTGDNGQAKISIKLPDSLTTWRLAAIANTQDSAFGANVSEFVVNRDLMIRPVLPRFLSVGDKADLGAIIVNTSGSPVVVKTSINAKGLTVDSSNQQSSSIANGGQVKLLWPTTAGSTTSAEIRFEVSDSTGGLRDSLIQTLPVETYSVPETVATAGQAADTAQETILLPKDTDPTQGQAELTVSPSLGSGSLDAINYLLDYPYNCMEQTTSKMIPAIYSLRIFNQAKVDRLDNITKTELEGMVEDAIQRLNNSQHSDGGWGWWLEGDSDPMISAYVYLGLTAAKNDKFPVSDKTVSGAKNYLLHKLAYPDEDMSLDNEAFLVYVLKDDKVNLSAYATTLFTRRFELSIEARARLAIILKQLGMSTQANRLYSEVVSLAKKTATSTHWEDSGRKYWYWFGSAETTTSAGLEMLMAFNPKHPYVAEVVRYLMASRTENHWSSTLNTAMTVRAIASQMLTTESKNMNLNYKLEVNGDQTNTGNFQAKDLLLSNRYVFPVSELGVGQENLFRLTKSGTGNLYYNFNLRYFLPFTEISPLDQGMVVVRDLIDSRGHEIDKTSIKEGTEVWVRLTVVAPALRQYVILEDKLPAGFEAVNESLKNVVSLNKEPPKTTNEGWYFYHKEYHDDRTTLFARYLPAGIYEVTYKVRATTPGEYHYLPAQAYEMYFPDVSGHSDGGWLEVIPD